MSAETVEILKKQLRAKFPQAHAAWSDEGREKETGGMRLREAEFPAGEITELVPEGVASGISLVVAGLLGDADGTDEVAPYPELVLVDGADAFDPGSFGGAVCSKLLWVRCRSALEMVKAADLVVRDGNVPFVLLDAVGVDRRELRDLPASVWWRLKQVAEGNGCRLVVMSPVAMVPCAKLRLTVSAGLELGDFERERGEVVARVELRRGGVRRHGMRGHG
ncbi:MAG: hypothetical protein ACQCXQ_13965 [Verrucomicrobiales bacterium]|nr:hypothetical protein [Verrucomicrobiota bacterium JB025]